MLQPLPRETIIDARRRVRRFRILLFVLVVVLSIVFLDLLLWLVAVIGWLIFEEAFDPFAHAWPLTGIFSAAAMVIASVHYWLAMRVPLDDLLRQLRAAPADASDSLHRRFRNVVEEAEVATGLRPIAAVVVPTTGYNAFVIEDGRRRRAIGVTEGLLGRLGRPELAAVVAHEAVHLVAGRARLATTACTLVDIFYRVRKDAGAAIDEAVGLGHSRQELPIHLYPFWAVAAVAETVLSVTSLCLSRKQVELADVHGAEMCRDPISLASALDTIAGKYRGSIGFPRRFAPLFILNPHPSRLDEEEGLFAALFSGHPPARRRIERLMQWAAKDVRVLADSARKKRAQREALAEATERRWFVHRGDSWEGPYGEDELRSLGVDPMDWVAIDGELLRACRGPGFVPAAGGDVTQSAPGAGGRTVVCPRCETPLVDGHYEGAPLRQCRHCGGHLVGPGVIERIIARDSRLFSERDRRRTVEWRRLQPRRLGAACDLPSIRCPACGSIARKVFHSALTRVVVDRCSRSDCGHTWLDGGELERVEVLVEDARARE